ncbi:MAG TPA: TonB-dependent receptor, partial [Thermoanaerobaculia bacterium]
GSAEGRAPLSLSEESIKEFSVITNGASVEFGRSGGGFVNVITKSGTNDYHGSGFFYWQPEALIANFANGTEPRDQDKMQFGGSLGGPILKDQLFFFASFDDQLRDETIPIASNVLDPDIFAAYPELASPSDYIQTQDGWVAFGRLDWQASSGQRVMGRVNRIEYDGLNGTSNSQTRTLSYNGIEGMTTWALVGQWSGQFGASAINDLSVNYVDEDTPRLDKGRNLTEVQLGTSRYGEVAFLPIVSTSKRFGIGDTFTYLLSSHVLKGGGEYNDTTIDQVFKGNWRGVYVFNNKSDLLAGNWREYRQFGGLNGLTADEAGRADFGQKEYAGFLQDQWFVNSKLTVTLGVRYEYLNNPNDPVLNQNDVNPDGTFELNGEIPDSKNQWSPRLGVSYAPDAKTAVRLAAGRYWSRTPALLWAQLFTSNGIRATQYIVTAQQSGGNVVGPPTGLAPGWGDAFDPEGTAPLDFSLVSSAPRPGVFAVDPDFENPHTDRITLGFEREIFPLVSAALEGTYAKTYHLQRLKDLNRVYSGGTAPNGLPAYSTTRPNIYYGRITTNVSDAQSIYDAISLQLSRRYAQNWSAGVVVTFSHDRDNDSNERNFAGIQAEDYNNIALNYGYSNRDQRWKLAANGIWDTPLWEISLSGSLRYQTGSTYNATANSDLNGDGEGTTDRPTVGGVHFGRNTFRQPDFTSLDLQIAKRFEIKPVGIQIAAQCFNCTNAGNRFVTDTVWGTAETPRATFGQPIGVGTPLTGQVAIRVDF